MSSKIVDIIYFITEYIKYIDFTSWGYNRKIQLPKLLVQGVARVYWFREVRIGLTIFLLFVLLYEFIIYPTNELCDKIFNGRQFGCLRLIEYGLSARLTIELRELSHNL